MGGGGGGRIGKGGGVGGGSWGGPQSVPAQVSVVLVEESFGVLGWASVPVDLDEQMLAEVVCPAGVDECMDGFILPMLAGTVSPSDVAEQVADDTASLADARIPFPADRSRPTLSPPDPAGILFPAVPAEMPFPAGPVGPVGPVGTLSPSVSARILFPAVPAGKLFPVAPDQDGTLSPTDPAGVLFPAVLTEFLVLQLPADPTVLPGVWWIWPLWKKCVRLFRTW